MRKTLVIAAMAAVLAFPAHAGATWDAVGLGVGIGGIWSQDSPGDDAATRRSMEAVGRGALSLSPHISIPAGIAYGFSDGGHFRGSVSARITATDVNDRTFSVGIGVGRHFTSEPPNGLEEWAGEAAVGYKPLEGSPFILTALAAVGLETQRPMVTASIIYPFKLVGSDQ